MGREDVDTERHMGMKRESKINIDWYEKEGRETERK